MMVVMNGPRVLKGQAMTTLRRLILIDIENINGGPVRSLAAAQWCHHVLKTVLELMPGDLITIACNGDAQSLLNTFRAWGPSVRLVPGYGRDGADRALLAVMNENIEARFTDVVVVSGDGIFADRVAELATRGVATHVFSHPEQLSARLRLAATTIHPITIGSVDVDSLRKEGA